MGNNNFNDKLCNFSEYELGVMKYFLIQYNKYLESIRGKAQKVISPSHVLKYRTKKLFCLGDNMDNFLDYFELSEFDTISRIECRGYNHVFKMLSILVEGTICLYGIKNEYGFYDVETNNFFSNIEIERDNMVISGLDEVNGYGFSFERGRLR